MKLIGSLMDDLVGIDVCLLIHYFSDWQKPKDENQLLEFFVYFI